MSLRSELEHLSELTLRNDIVLFKPLTTEADLIYAAYDCQLTEEQRNMVNPAWFSIGRAYLHPDDNFPCIICTLQKEPIGFINLSRWIGDGDHCSWSFFIDKDHQGKGYGRSAAQLAISTLKQVFPEKQIKLATERINEKAQRLYRSLGFSQLPETDGDDLVFGL